MQNRLLYWAVMCLENLGDLKVCLRRWMYTDKLFTGQREMTGLGIYHYGARFYSQKLGRFLSADTLVPNPYNPQDLNRFSYVRNNPLRYTDPNGHMLDDGDDGGCYPCTLLTPTNSVSISMRG
jgi:RHS repeat-associated protein